MITTPEGEEEGRNERQMIESGKYDFPWRRNFMQNCLLKYRNKMYRTRLNGFMADLRFLAGK